MITIDNEGFFNVNYFSVGRKVVPSKMDIFTVINVLETAFINDNGESFFSSNFDT